MTTMSDDVVFFLLWLAGWLAARTRTNYSDFQPQLDTQERINRMKMITTYSSTSTS